MDDAELVGLEDVEGIIERIRRKLEGKVEEAYVLGSVVEGAALRGESDLDLLIVPRERIDFHGLLEEELLALLDMGLAMDLLVADNPSFHHLIVEARRRGFRIL